MNDYISDDDISDDHISDDDISGGSAAGDKAREPLAVREARRGAGVELDPGVGLRERQPPARGGGYPACKGADCIREDDASGKCGLCRAPRAAATCEGEVAPVHQQCKRQALSCVRLRQRRPCWP